MFAKEGTRPSSEPGPKQCDSGRHHYGKWAAWTVEYPNEKPQHFCEWCFRGEKKRLKKGAVVTPLVPKKRGG